MLTKKMNITKQFRQAHLHKTLPILWRSWWQNEWTCAFYFQTNTQVYASNDKVGVQSGTSGKITRIRNFKTFGQLCSDTTDSCIRYLHFHTRI